MSLTRDGRALTTYEGTVRIPFVLLLTESRRAAALLDELEVTCASGSEEVEWGNEITRSFDVLKLLEA